VSTDLLFIDSMSKQLMSDIKLN